MLGFAIVMIVNYPNLQDQKDRLHAHAGNILTVVSMIFAAGVFTGIIDGTGMVSAMADTLIAVIPDALGPKLTVIVALISMPFTVFMANAPFYFGIIPIMAETAANFGIPSNGSWTSFFIRTTLALVKSTPRFYLYINGASWYRNR